MISGGDHLPGSVCRKINFEEADERYERDAAPEAGADDKRVEEDEEDEDDDEEVDDEALQQQKQ